jgi:hypothetical protein
MHRSTDVGDVRHVRGSADRRHDDCIPTEKAAGNIFGQEK